MTETGSTHEWLLSAVDYTTAKEVKAHWFNTGENTHPFRLASGKASGVKILPNQICRATRCGDPCCMRQQLKVAFRGHHGGAVVSTVDSQQESLEFKSTIRLGDALVMLVWVLSSCSNILPREWGEVN